MAPVTWRGPACVVLAVALVSVTGCVGPLAKPPGIKVLHLEVRNEASAPIEIHAKIVDPFEDKLVDDDATVRSGRSVAWTAGPLARTAGNWSFWSIDLDGTSRNRALLMESESHSGAGWSIQVSVCPGPEAWLRFVAHERHTSSIEVMDAPYASLDGGAISCDGIHWFGFNGGQP